jgi:phosphohistidine phosphatase
MTADRLYFAQHGIAIDKAEDPERPLSKNGIDQTTSVAKRLRAADVLVTNIFHSNKVRSQQTAEIFSSILMPTKISEIDHLSPNDDTSLIKPYLTSNNALYIGHLPHLEKLISSLIADDEDLSIIKFQNSAVICLEKKETRYQILWYITPQTANLR